MNKDSDIILYLIIIPRNVLQAWQQGRGAAVFQTDTRGWQNNVTHHLNFVRLARQVGGSHSWAAGHKPVLVELVNDLHVCGEGLQAWVTLTLLLMVQDS